MSRKRIFILLLVLAIVIIAAVGSWLIGSNIKSPAEMAARTAPPIPSPILVPVEERVLSSEIVTRGTARYGRPLSISIAPSIIKDGAGIITALPERNTQLREGTLVMTASGRPVFVLKGRLPVYRDLVPGISGEDVLQLKHALQRMGIDPGPLDSKYNNQTSAAVARWYASEGWQPFGATVNQNSAIKGLEQDLAAVQYDQQVANDAVTAAPKEVEAARAAAEKSIKVAASEVKIKTAIRDRVLADRRSTKEERLAADEELDVATVGLKSVQLDAELQIQSAVNSRNAAERQANLIERKAVQIGAELEAAKRDAGIKVPADEIIFVPTLPVRVEQIDVALGDAAQGKVISVTNNLLMIDSSLPLDEAPLVKPGMSVAIDESSLGIKARGSVKRVAGSPGTDGADGFHIYFEVRVDHAPMKLEGFSLRLTIPVESTGGAVMAVPISALSLAADGTSRVQVERNGAFEFVVVDPGLTATGYVEIRPSKSRLAPGEMVVIGYEKEE